MSHGVLYFWWRDGRPRWIPPKRWRDRGFKGRDLKDGRGQWLPLEDALAKAREINRSLPGIPPGVSARTSVRRGKKIKRIRTVLPDSPGPRGYVYFLVCGERVKIGFSVRPISRVAALSGAHPDPIELLLVVPGTQDQERNIHMVLAEFRTGGEWFVACRQVLNLMIRCAHARCVVYGKTTPRKIISQTSRPM